MFTKQREPLRRHMALTHLDTELNPGSPRDIQQRAKCLRIMRSQIDVKVIPSRFIVVPPICGGGLTPFMADRRESSCPCGPSIRSRRRARVGLHRGGSEISVDTVCDHRRTALVG